MNDEEREALTDLMKDMAISPAFVRRLVGEHGIESLAEAFLIGRAPSELALEVLLRRYKGPFYRKRYPTLSIKQPDTKAHSTATFHNRSS